MSKWQKWYDSLPAQTKTYLEKQPIWYDRDLYKAAAVGVVIGVVLGFLVGYEIAWKPAINTFRPLIG